MKKLLIGTMMASLFLLQYDVNAGESESEEVASEETSTTEDAGQTENSTDYDFVNAAMNGDLETVESLIDEVSNEETKDDAFRWAASNGHESIVSYLIEKGVNVDGQGSTGDTALMYAAGANNLEMVKVLIEKGANVNIENEDGNTVVFVAAYKNNLEMVKYVVEHGADVNKVNNNGYTAASYATDEEISNYLKEKTDPNADNSESSDEESSGEEDSE